MATYLKGSRDYIPQIQPFQPDFNFYNAVLQTKESQYQAGYDKLSKLYDTLLNSELSRDINIERRNKFFQQIGNDIKKISSLDLSLEQNVDAAYNVFKPFINDKNVVKDMAWTKTYNKALGKSEYFKNCTSEECKDQYWSDGVRYLNYMRNDFSKATDDEAMMFQSPRYVPYVNVVKDATKFAKEMGVSIQYIDNDGKYLITTTNGEKLIPTLTDYFVSVYGNDPRVKDVYEVKGALARKDYIMSKAPEIGEEAAEREFLGTVFDAVKKQQKALEDLNNQHLGKIIDKKQALAESVKQDGVDMDDPSIAEMISNLNQQEQVARTNVNIASTNLQIVNDDAIADQDISSLRYRADSALASSLLLGDLYNAAYSYSMMTKKQEDIKPDPYALAKYQNDLAMKLEEYKTIMDITKERAKGSGSTKDLITKSITGNDYAATEDANYVAPETDIDLQGNFNAILRNYSDAAYDKGKNFLTDVYAELNHIAVNNKGNKLGEYANEQILSIFGAPLINHLKEKGRGMDSNGNLNDYGVKWILDNMPNMNNTVDKAYEVIADKDNQKILFNNPRRLEVLNNLKRTKTDYDVYSETNKLIKTAHTENFENAVNYIKGIQLSDEYEGGIRSTLADITATVYSWLTPDSMMPGNGTTKELEDMLKDKMLVEKDPKAPKRLRIDYMMGPDKTMRPKSSYINEIYKKQVANKPIELDVNIDANIAYVKDPITGDQYEISNQLAERIGKGVYNTYKDLETVKENLGYWINNKDASIISRINKSIGEEYDDFASSIKEVYNSGNQAVGVKSIDQVPGGQSIFVRAGVATIDPAKFESQAWADGLSVFDNLRDVEGINPEARIIYGPAKNIISTELDPEKLDRADAAAKAFLTKFFYTDWKEDNANRPFVQFYPSSIGYNKGDLTAYTFKILNVDDYIKNNKSSATDAEKNMYDYLDDTGIDGEFTIVIPRKNTNNLWFNRTTESPYELQYKMNGKVSINDPESGSIDITRTGTGAKITGSFIYTNPINGAPQVVNLDNDGPIFVKGMPAIDDIIADFQGETQKIYAQNLMTKMALRNNKNVSYDINQYLNK
jgi:hypothetical protein